MLQTPLTAVIMLKITMATILRVNVAKHLPRANILFLSLMAVLLSTVVPLMEVARGWGWEKQ